MTRFLLVFALLTNLPAQIVINELSATSNDRVFTRDDNGVARLNSGIQWWEVAFDDSRWNTGTTPIGFGYDDIDTNVSSAVRFKTPTLYLRQSFTLTMAEAASGESLTLQMDYDDSFIAYLNGREIARADAAAPGSPHYASQISYNSNLADGSGTSFSIGVVSDFLVTGENVLAIEVHNEEIDSSTLKALPLLSSPSKMFINSGDSCCWFPGVISPSGGVFDPAFVEPKTIVVAPWARPNHDVTSWLTGIGPIGYETSATDPYALGTNLTEMMGNQSGVMMRTTFELTAAQLANITELQLEVDYDDGFLAYLNGREVARGNLGTAGQPVASDAIADGEHGASTDDGGTFDPDLITIPATHLRVGINVLAGQVHNRSIDSPDLILHLALRTIGAEAMELVVPDALFSYFIGTQEPAGGGSTLATSDLDFEDWIELHNPSGSVVDLSGWSLSDSATSPRKFTFPAGTSLGAGGFLLVIADEQDEFNGLTDYLHASFKLSRGGEDLLLTDVSGNIQSQITGGFPKQYARQSYGWDSLNSLWGYFDHPTPGTANGAMTLAGKVDAPDFDPPGGFHDSAMMVTLTSETPDVMIRYTLDGSEPTATTGLLYTGSPINLASVGDGESGHVVRAKAFKAGLVPSNVKTHTYLVGIDAGLKGVPALVFSGDEEETFYKEHGVMSIEGGANVGLGWLESGPDSYNIALMRGPEFERPLFLEFHYADGTPGFREDAGVRLAASGFSRPRLILNDTARSPWLNAERHKPSFNLYFRDEYGKDTLEVPWLGVTYQATKFRQLRVRAGKNDISDPFIVDEVVRRLFSEMGQESSVGVINTLYVNGKYKGFFNMCERLREPFMQEHHGGNEEWDVRQSDDYANGDATSWNTMISILSRSGNGELSLSDWQEALEYLDPVNMADYFLLNIYGATFDWPNNWVGARERSPEGRYRLYVWDAEFSYHTQGLNNDVSYDSFSGDGNSLLNQGGSLHSLFRLLLKSPEWRLIFADRINKQMFNDGPLDHRDRPNSTFRKIILELEALYEPVLQHDFGQSISTAFYNSWSSSTTGRRRYLFGDEGSPPRVADRTDFADNGLWPAITPPVFSQHGGAIGSGVPVTINAAPSSEIYFTTDGSDPREVGGVVQSGLTPYSSAISFSPGRTVVKARAKNGSDWSAMTEVEFIVDLAAPTSMSMVISEFLFHPPNISASEMAAGFTDEDDFEFIELMNTSATDTVDLADLSFTDGISFSFSGADVDRLLPGERVLIVADRAAFEARYGTGHSIAGEFGGKFVNSSETVTLTLGGNIPTTIHSFTYDDAAPWPACADGPGFSLVLINPESNPDHDVASNWICSTNFGGDLNGSSLEFNYARWAEQNFTFAQLADTSIIGSSQDPDGDGFNNFLEFAFGADPNTADAAALGLSFSTSNVGGVDYPVVTFDRSGFVNDLQFDLAAATALDDWGLVAKAGYVRQTPMVLSDGRVRESWRLTTAFDALPKRFFRVVVALP